MRALVLLCLGLAVLPAYGQLDRRLERAIEPLSRALTGLGALRVEGLDPETTDGLRGAMVYILYEQLTDDGAKTVSLPFFALDPHRRVRPELKETLPWPGEPTDLRQPYHLGNLGGLIWFGRLAPYEYAWIADMAPFRGGEDVVDVLIRGLGGPGHALCVEGLAARPGPTVRAVESRFGRDDLDDAKRRSLLEVLGAIRTIDSTRLLAHLYRSHGGLREDIARAMTVGGLRPGARDLYFDMLDRRLVLPEVLPQLRGFGWFEALPHVEALEADPPNWEAWRLAALARRSLRDREVAAAHLEQAYELGKPDHLWRAPDFEVLAGLEAALDEEACAILGLDLARRACEEGWTQSGQAAWRLLRKGRVTALAWIERLSKALPAESAFLQEVRERLSETDR